MPRPRTPVEKAKVTGREVKDPGRFEGRAEPQCAQLGEPSAHLNENAQAAWEQFKKECFWLNESHRAFVEIAATIRGRMIAQEDVGVQALNLLRQCLGQMGATPADASKVAIPDGQKEDPDDKFYN